MIDQLLPAGVATAEAFNDPPDAVLFPAEAAVVAQAVEKRRREFATGRHLARRALAALGIGAAPLLPGQRREPGWPAGVVGSITHCAGYRAAAVAMSDAVRAIGIDAEPNEPVPAGVLNLVALPDERHRIAALLSTRPEVSWDRLLFSAKESVYKAWFPLAGRWLGFEDAMVSIDPAGGFTARLLVPGPTLPGGTVLAGFRGRWLVRQGLVLTAIAVPARD